MLLKIVICNLIISCIIFFLLQYFNEYIDNIDNNIATYNTIISTRSLLKAGIH